MDFGWERSYSSPVCGSNNNLKSKRAVAQEYSRNIWRYQRRDREDFKAVDNRS